MDIVTMDTHKRKSKHSAMTSSTNSSVNVVTSSNNVTSDDLMQSSHEVGGVLTSGGVVTSGGGAVTSQGGGTGNTEQPEKARKTDMNASFLRAARSGNVDKVLEHIRNKTDINGCNANGMNALHLGAKEGHFKVVAELISHGADVNAATNKGNTALHICSLAGHRDIVRLLVENGAKINAQSKTGFSPLYMAAQENHIEIVQYLLGKGASPSVATEEGFTPLAVALQQGHDKVVAILLESDTKGKVHLPALHIAAKKDDVKSVALLLQNEHNHNAVNDTGCAKAGDLVNDTTKSQFTPLHIAAHYGNVNVAQLLIEKGADVSFKARNNITPLHVAAKWGTCKMISLLLENSANIECRTRDGLTPLHCAARSGHDAAVDLLLEKGAQVLAKTKNGLSPLHMSVQGDHVDCSRLLLYHKAPIDDITTDYLTPLHVAAHCGNVKTAKLLLDRRCDVNARALNGFTPLHIACKKNRLKVVELLIKYGATVEATTESGLTSLHVVSFIGHMNIAMLLIQHGACPNTVTVRGETALHLAVRANQTDIIRILLRNNAQVNAHAKEQQTSLHIASRLGHVDDVALLLQHGASPDAATRDLYTSLHIATKEGHLEVVQTLLEHGANHSLATKKGFTALHLAAKHGHVRIARALLQRNCDPNIEGRNCLTPLHIATHYNRPDVAQLLLEHGACPQRVAKNGFTSLHVAAKKNRMEVTTVLLNHMANVNAESRNGYTALHLASSAGHADMVALLVERGADYDWQAKNGLAAMHLAAQEDRVGVAKVLLTHGAKIDPQTRAGYTPLHTACHFGQTNMIRFLLENGTNVNCVTKIGYTPLHQSAQQGQLAVINILMKYKAAPDMLAHNGLSALGIAQRLGYISVVELLKRVTTIPVSAPPPPASIPSEEKYKPVIPETMQEAAMSESEDEGAEDALAGGEQSMQYLTSDDLKILQDDSISLIKDDRDMTTYDRAAEYTSVSSSMCQSVPGEDVKGGISEIEHALNPLRISQLVEKVQIESPRMYSSLPGGASPIKPSLSEADCHSYAPPTYTGPNFTSISADNITVARPPRHAGMLRWRSFLVSFVIDARGGALQGSRHSGVRVIIPPGKACQPTRVTCRLIKVEKLSNPPPLMEGEALAGRILEMGPICAKFTGPVVIEVPHFASLRGREREITILRSDDGLSWREHTMQATEEAIQDAVAGTFDELDSMEELQAKRIVRILTVDFPQYFALMTRCRQESASVGAEGSLLSSTLIPQVQAVFPPGALIKTIRVGLQAQPVHSEIVAQMLGNRVAVSPIVTVEPRRRKFHKPITLTVPLPASARKGMLNQCSPDSSATLHLLCSIMGGTTLSQWEDVTGTTPLSFSNDCVTFTTSVSARFWLMDCQTLNEAAKMAADLYKEVVAVPVMAKFIVYARRNDAMEARLRIFCTTDDRIDKTLEMKEHFVEVARSKDVEVLEGRRNFLDVAGNLIPVTKARDQMAITFQAFRDNRISITVRVKDALQDPVGRLTFTAESVRTPRSDTQITPVCSLNITLAGDIYPEGSAASRHGGMCESISSMKETDSCDMNKTDSRLASILDVQEHVITRDCRKDSVTSSSVESCLPHVSSREASYDDRDLLRTSETSAADQSWSETASFDSREVEMDKADGEGDMLTPVIEDDNSTPCEKPISRVLVDKLDGMDDTTFGDRPGDANTNSPHGRLGIPSSSTTTSTSTVTTTNTTLSGADQNQNSPTQRSRPQTNTSGLGNDNDQLRLDMTSESTGLLYEARVASTTALIDQNLNLNLSDEDVRTASNYQANPVPSPLLEDLGYRSSTQDLHGDTTDVSEAQMSLTIETTSLGQQITDDDQKLTITQGDTTQRLTDILPDKS